jgi:hypothetical protein
MVRREPVRRPEVRQALRDRLVRSIERYEPWTDVVTDDGQAGIVWHPGLRRLEALDAGEPYECYWWEIARFLTPQEKSEHGRWRVLVDGTIEPVSDDSSSSP